MRDDWTRGAPAIAFQRCRLCGQAQYFRRDFCAACGSHEVDDLIASGEGIVFAATQVCRAATEAARASVPYTIVLVDAAEGFRMMAHGDHALAIGDRVRARYTDFAGRLVPYFERISS